MDRVLVGVDGSQSARAALSWAVGAAQAMDAELVPVHAGEPTSDLESLEAFEAVGGRSRTVAVAGDARQVLPDVADSENASLVVVGAGDAGWFPAVHLGSVSHHLAVHCDRPLCVVPPTCDNFDARHIVVGLDGSPGSAAAAEWATALAARLGSTVAAVHAWEPAVSRLAPASPEASRRAAVEDCEQWASVFRDADVPTDLVVEEEGDPATCVARVVQDTSAQLLVVGTRGAGGFHDLRLGSVALRLLHHGAVPIVLVPPPA